MRSNMAPSDRSLSLRRLLDLRAVRVWLALAYVLAVSSIVLLKDFDRSYDDAYITFRYADNLYRQQGFVYNPGEQVLSTTTPLFAGLLALLEHFSTDAPHLANVVGSISIALGALALGSLAWSWRSPWVGAASLLLYPTFPLLLITLSSEMLLYLLFCISAFAFYARNRLNLAVMCAALAVLTRGDGILVPAVLAVDYVVRVRRPPPSRTILLLMVPLVAWAAFAWSYFGSPLPATLAAKQQQGAMLISERFAPGLLVIMRNFMGSWPFLLEGILGAIGISALIRNGRAWLPFLLWTVLYFGTYSMLGVSRYFWYYAPLVPGLIVVVGLGIGWLYEYGPRQGELRWFLPIALLGVLAYGEAQPLLADEPYAPDTRIAIYRATGEWLESNTPPHAAVGTLEVGVIGYYSHRRMIDFAGLIQPAVASRLTPTATYLDTTLWAIDHYRPDYLVILDSQRSALTVYSPSCATVQTFNGFAYNFADNVNIIRCGW